MKRLLGFHIAYWIGILVAIGMAFNPLGVSMGLDWDLNLSQETLLLFSVSHMVVLAVLGFITPLPLNTIAGAKVQTAGYLHTLNGFSAALLLIGISGDEDLTLIALLLPLGSALLTSIIGWFLGGEIVSRGEAKRGRSVELETTQVAEELQSFADKVHQVHESYYREIGSVSSAFSVIHKEVERFATTAQDPHDNYVKAVNAAIGSLEHLNAKQRKTLSEITSLVESLAQALTPLDGAVATLRTRIKTLADNVEQHLGKEFEGTLANLKHQGDQAATSLQQVAADASEVSKHARSSASYLKQSQELIREFERIMTTNRLDDIEVSYEPATPKAS